MKALFVLALLIGGAFAAWKIAYPSVTVRYRLTLEAEVDGKPVSGSGVIEATYAKQPRISPEAGSTASGVRGEAVTLDLGARGLLFAILKAGKDSSYRPEYIAVQVLVRRDLEDADIITRVRNLRGKAEVPLDKLWMLVRFRDIGDPKSVEAVDPNDLAKNFGTGVKLMRATIEMTDDPVTTGIEKLLPPWFAERRQKKASLDGDTSIARFIKAPLANQIGTGYFKRGF